MPKEVVVTGIGNRIEYATTNGKGLITGKREDITDPAVAAVYEHMKVAHSRLEEPSENYGYVFEDGGKLLYIPKKEEETE